MICIISKKNDLISYGLYKAFKTLSKNVEIIYNEVELKKLKNIKIYVINNYDFIEDIDISNESKYLLINENCIFENRLNINKCKYYIIKEYSKQINLSDYKKINEYIYTNNNIIIFPFCSIFTKNEILWNYKKKFIKNKNIKNNILTFDNINIDHKKKLKNIKYQKINLNSIENIITHSKNNQIFLSTYDHNKFDYKSISFMAMGNFSITNSELNKNIFNILEYDINYNLDLHKIIQNIQLIYNDFTLEKYIKIINNYFLLLV